MRDIKFRVFEKETNKINPWILIFGDLWVLEEGDVVMQFTGLKDKNGKEIYEGDIVREEFEVGGKKYYTLFVCEFYVLHSESGFTFYSKESSHDIQLSKSEVIGNIYENPELLEVKQ